MEEQILEGFTYEELSEDGTLIEVPSEITDNTIVIDSDENKPPLKKPIVKPKKKIPPKKEENEEEVQVVVKKVSRRNNSRKILLTGYEVSSEDLELSDFITLDYREYSEVLKKYIFKGLFLYISIALRDNMKLTDKEMVLFFRKSIPGYMRKLTETILSQHKAVEAIEGFAQVELTHQAIEIRNVIDFKFPNHPKIYETQDMIRIPV